MNTDKVKQECYSKEYYRNCLGCKIFQGEPPPAGGAVLKLDGNWMLNHYGGKEGFLGWLILQPMEHKYLCGEWTKRKGTKKKWTNKELEYLGKHIKNISEHLHKYWKDNFFNDEFKDEIKRIYVVCFSECFHNDEPALEPHLHFHIIPRTQKMADLKKCNGSRYYAWNICQAFGHISFPERYVTKAGKQNKNVEELMNYLKDNLPLQKKCDA